MVASEVKVAAEPVAEHVVAAMAVIAVVAAVAVGAAVAVAVVVEGGMAGMALGKLGNTGWAAAAA